MSIYLISHQFAPLAFRPSVSRGEAADVPPAHERFPTRLPFAPAHPRAVWVQYCCVRVCHTATHYGVNEITRLCIVPYRCKTFESNIILTVNKFLSSMVQYNSRRYRVHSRIDHTSGRTTHPLLAFLLHSCAKYGSSTLTTYLH